MGHFDSCTGDTRFPIETYVCPFVCNAARQGDEGMGRANKLLLASRAETWTRDLKHWWSPMNSAL